MSISMSDPCIVPAEWADNTYWPNRMKSLPCCYDLLVCMDLVGTKLWVYASGTLLCPSGLRLRNTLWSDGAGWENAWCGVSLCFFSPLGPTWCLILFPFTGLFLFTLLLTPSHGQLQAGPQNHTVCRVPILSQQRQNTSNLMRNWQNNRHRISALIMCF